MIKKSILLLSALFTLGVNANAQKCGTDEAHAELKKLYPHIQEIQDALDLAWKGGNAYAKTTSDNANFDKDKTKEYDSVVGKKVIIPVVVHVIHDYGTSDYVADNTIFQMISNLNTVYAAQNADLSNVIAPFKSYVGKANIEFRLAQRDPAGNATIGITRRRSYLTNGGDDQAKMDLWAPERYLNIWVIRRIGRSPASGTILAYATLPAGAAGNPFNDGVISGSDYLVGGDKTIEHEVGHYLNLYHPWNNSGAEVGASCGDDEVDDTPPTKGHFSTCPLYDTNCASGYKKTYSYYDKDSLKVVQVTQNYPDTTNTQNIMDYSNCVNMFTKQQVMRMRNTLNNSVANRNNLITTTTQQATGVGDTTITNYRKDLKPVPDFSIERNGVTNEGTYFLCADNVKLFNFRNRSWRDTVTAVEWSFSNGANPAAISSSGGTLNSIISTKFSTPGWVTITMKATGNNSGDTTIERKSVYAADNSTKINPASAGFYQEFNDAAELEKWPIFNYYDNDYKWEVTKSSGYYDNTSIVYKGYDYRTYPGGFVGAPAILHPTTGVKLGGDVDDFFTPAFDLSGMKGGECNLNFMSAGMWRTTNVNYMKDSMEIAYSTDCGGTWKTMSVLTKAQLMKGTQAIAFQPLSANDWDLKSMSIPEDARQSTVYFRFRYKPFSDNSTFFNLGVGNHYYIDRINISSFPAGINTLVGNGATIAVMPNPTTSNAFVVVRDMAGTVANVTVTDITGKVVYRTQQTLNSKVSQIEIPANALPARGVYIVNVLSGTQSKTEKLVVN